MNTISLLRMRPRTAAALIWEMEFRAAVPHHLARAVEYAPDYHRADAISEQFSQRSFCLCCPSVSPHVYIGRFAHFVSFLGSISFPSRSSALAIRRLVAALNRSHPQEPRIWSLPIETADRSLVPVLVPRIAQQ